MTQAKPKAFLFCLASALFLTLWPPVSQAKKAAKPPPAPRFDREQFMLMNLNRGHGSTGYYLVESLRQSRNVSQDLEKALHQLEQVDKAYARSRGKPDDRYLLSSADHIRAAKKTADLLESQLRDSFQDLKSTIQQTLVLE